MPVAPSRAPVLKREPSVGVGGSGGPHALQVATFAAALLFLGLGGAGRMAGWPGGAEAASIKSELPEVVLFDPSALAAPAAAASERSEEEVSDAVGEIVESETILDLTADFENWEARPLPELPELPELPAKPVRRTVPRPAATSAAAGPERSESAPEPSRSTAATPGRSGGGGQGTSPAPQALRFGVGEGRQPAPTYPSSALRRNQEGTVVVEFLVAADGRVLSAEAFQPSPYPLLNSAAVDTVRRRWKFRPGAVRSYRVPIIFRIE